MFASPARLAGEHEQRGQNMIDRPADGQTDQQQPTTGDCITTEEEKDWREGPTSGPPLQQIVHATSVLRNQSSFIRSLHDDRLNDNRPCVRIILRSHCGKVGTCVVLLHHPTASSAVRRSAMAVLDRSRASVHPSELRRTDLCGPPRRLLTCPVGPSVPSDRGQKTGGWMNRSTDRRMDLRQVPAPSRRLFLPPIADVYGSNQSQSQLQARSIQSAFT
ncbi:hypothetical protein BO94DRAFT_545277 [Aspergillus sclerotioniger CBS 115572]|uniref:Uncharacterized protein n=1 Tax=Aspergillus sclerotioniger CBS 115572 TaxID=1450535 RepID=A0A317WVZ0_9EURO|nr:hypothetical protein BO94DRAFT_545277 [Aspergillus sclerotioniger CBS 115572]PWY90546.1 hypothetical protein BO94DRAFT_545277 [Aspergillus sclerotioniger CBS 115572]